MRIETHDKKHIVCGYIMPARYILPGQLWMSSSNNIVEVVYCDNDHVCYCWNENGETRYHDKDVFSFQCRYCLIIGE